MIQNENEDYLEYRIVCIWKRSDCGTRRRAHEQRVFVTLKSDSHLPKNCVICLIKRPLKLMENAFYFILKALFVFKIFKFLSRLFGHVGKMAWLEI